jgi:hypothetical protein
MSREYCATSAQRIAASRRLTRSWVKHPPLKTQFAVAGQVTPHTLWQAGPKEKGFLETSARRHMVRNEEEIS